ncbi:hypothetical protein CYMTET_3484 [Cymbomonas tetramitiformis]|uniref:EGF-like domain-containing protein n=1 Tax=Cymbomonas tetramitiformis TaxID=36881 RepID=A0AAE0H383_9CHLO|nr:hypothetical protein CYMTET_3484 [Cymbomonas tetramitiformis]
MTLYDTGNASTNCAQLGLSDFAIGLWVQASQTGSLTPWGTADGPLDANRTLSWSHAEFDYPVLQPELCGVASGLWTVSGLVLFQTFNQGMNNSLSGEITVSTAPPPPPMTLYPTTTPTTWIPTATPTTLSAQLAFSSSTVAEFDDAVQEELILLTAAAAGLSTSQVLIDNISPMTRRRRELRAEGDVAVVAISLEWFQNDVALVEEGNNGTGGGDGGGGAADPDAFTTSLMESPGSMFVSASSSVLTRDVAVLLVMTGGSITVATPSYPSPLPPPRPLHCPLGYNGNGTHCEDVDECALANGGCDNRTTCTNEVPGRTCGPCPAGFTGHGGQTGGCLDNDECSVNNGGCDFLSQCDNVPGSFSCGGCPAGYSGTGAEQCDDVDECEAEDSCDSLTVCTNKLGGYDCSKCPWGYSGTGKVGCTYALSCDQAPCDALVSCDEASGTVECGPCPAGFSGDGFSECFETDGCAPKPCFPGVTCTDVAAPGAGFVCGECPAGYVGDYGVGPEGCKLDLCPLGDACSLEPLVTCSMVTATQFACGACPAGFTGDGYVKAGVSSGCDDVDECTSNNPCDPLTKCINLRGGVECGACPNRFVGTGLAGCREVTWTCAENNGGCWAEGEAQAECTDTDPNTGLQLASPMCGACPAGYADTEGTPQGTACVDADDCDWDNCEAGVQCLDARPPQRGFSCAACATGYLGDGFNVTKYTERLGCYTDACFSNNGGCSTNPAVRCVSDRAAPNGRVCGPGCPAGYVDVYGDATLCEEEDSCEAHPCFSTAAVEPPVAVRCTDLPPPASGPDGRVCDPCPTGFAGDGETCEDVDECTEANRGCFSNLTLPRGAVVTACTNQLTSAAFPAGRQCGPCPDGYKGSGETECVWVELCGQGDRTETNGGCWVGQGAYNGLRTSCIDLPNQGGTECGECPAGMQSADGTGATGCAEIDSCVEEPCFPGVACTDHRAYEDPPDGRRCDFQGLAWTCPEGYKGNGVRCTECVMLVRIANATTVDGMTDRAGWQLDPPRTVQVKGELTGLDSPNCTNLLGTYFRWGTSVSDGSELALGAAHRAHTTALTLSKAELRVKASYVVAFTGVLRGNERVKASAELPFLVRSLPLAVVIAGGAVTTGDRLPVIVDATQSSDPDGAPGEMEFTWRCRVDGSTERCHTAAGAALPSVMPGPVLNLTMQGGFAPDPINYTFTLTAVKGDRTTVVSTRLTIFKGGAPVPTISPLVCAKPPCKVNTDAKLTLRSSIYSDDPGHLTTVWRVAASPPELAFDITSATCLTRSQNQDLVVRPGVLLPGGEYTFTLEATDRIGPSTAAVTLQVNTPPEHGGLSVQPANGTELETAFHYTAIGWVDEDRPLRYHLHYRVVGRAVTGGEAEKGAWQALGTDFTPTSARVAVVPEAGLEEHEFQVTVRLSVMDDLDAVSTMQVNVTVLPQATLSTDAVLAQAQTASLNGDSDGTLTFVRGLSAVLNEDAALALGYSDNATSTVRRRLLSQDANASQAQQQRSDMLDLVMVMQDELYTTEDTNAALAGVARAVVATPHELGASAQDAALGMFRSLAAGTAVSGAMADDVCNGLSSLTDAVAPAATSQRRRLRQSDEAGVEDSAAVAEVAAARAAQAVQVLTKLGDTLLAGAVADEEPVATSSPSLAMKVGLTRADLPTATLYSAPFDLGDGSASSATFPASLAPVLTAASRRRRRQLLQAQEEGSGNTSIGGEEVAEPLELAVRVLTTALDPNLRNRSGSVGDSDSGSGATAASHVQEVVLAAGGAEVAVSGLEEAIEIVIELSPQQQADRRRRRALRQENSDGRAGPRLECRFWSSAREVYDTEGCVTLPNPAPDGAQLQWRTWNMSQLEGPAMAWKVGNASMTAGCEEHFGAVLDPAVWNGTDAGYPKWAAPVGEGGVYVANAGCELVANSSQCRWEWRMGMFVGAGCVHAPELRCLCTHLTDFKAVENTEVGEVGPPDLEGPTISTMLEVDLLGSVVLLAVVLGIIGTGVALSTASGWKQKEERQAILTALVEQFGTGISGFREFNGVWTWSLLEEDRVAGVQKKSDRMWKQVRNKLARTKHEWVETRMDQMVFEIAHSNMSHAQRHMQMQGFTAAQKAAIMQRSVAAKMLMKKAHKVNPRRSLVHARKSGDAQAIHAAQAVLQRSASDASLASKCVLRCVRKWKRKACVGGEGTPNRPQSARRSLRRSVSRARSFSRSMSFNGRAVLTELSGRSSRILLGRSSRRSSGRGSPEDNSPASSPLSAAARGVFSGGFKGGVSRQQPQGKVEKQGPHTHTLKGGAKRPKGILKGRRPEEPMPLPARCDATSSSSSSSLPSGHTLADLLNPIPSAPQLEPPADQLADPVPSTPQPPPLLSPAPAQQPVTEGCPGRAAPRSLHEIHAQQRERHRRPPIAAAAWGDAHPQQAAPTGMIPHWTWMDPRPRSQLLEERPGPVMEGVGPSHPQPARGASARRAQEGSQGTRLAEPSGPASEVVVLSGMDPDAQEPESPEIKTSQSFRRRLSRSVSNVDNEVRKVMGWLAARVPEPTVRLMPPREGLAGSRSANARAAGASGALHTPEQEEALLKRMAAAAGRSDSYVENRHSRASTFSSVGREEEFDWSDDEEAASAPPRGELGHSPPKLRCGVEALVADVGNGVEKDAAAAVQEPAGSVSAEIENVPKSPASTPALVEVTVEQEGVAVPQERPEMAAGVRGAEGSGGADSVPSDAGFDVDTESDDADQSDPASRKSEVARSEAIRALQQALEAQPAPVPTTKPGSGEEVMLPLEAGEAARRSGVRTLERQDTLLPHMRRPNRHMGEVRTPPESPTGSDEDDSWDDDDDDDEWGGYSFNDAASPSEEGMQAPSDVTAGDEVRLAINGFTIPPDVGSDPVADGLLVPSGRRSPLSAGRPPRSRPQAKGGPSSGASAKGHSKDKGAAIGKFEMRYRMRAGNNKRDDRRIQLARVYADRFGPFARRILEHYVQGRAKVMANRNHQPAKADSGRGSLVGSVLGSFRRSFKARDSEGITDLIGALSADPAELRHTCRRMVVKILCYAHFVQAWRRFQDLHASSRLCRAMGISLMAVLVSVPVEGLRELVASLCEDQRSMQSVLVKLTETEKEEEANKMFGRKPGGTPPRTPSPTCYGDGEKESPQLNMERMLGTALVLAFMETSRLVQSKQVEGQLARASKVRWHLPAGKDLAWYTGVFKVMLRHNLHPEGWYTRRLLWNLLLLQFQDGSFALNGALASTLAAGNIRPHMRRDANAPLDDKELRQAKPDSLSAALKGEATPQAADKLWATLCAAACLHRLPFSWTFNPWDLPSDQRTPAQLAEGYLERACGQYPSLRAALPELRDCAAASVKAWHEARLEAIRGLRAETQANKLAAEQEMSQWERRQLHARELRRLWVDAVMQHPWVGLTRIPCTAAFTRSQRILVECNKLLVSLFVVLMLEYNKGLDCCVEYKEWLGCLGATTESACWGYSTCKELYEIRDKQAFPAVVYSRAEEVGQHPEDYNCVAFPNSREIMDQFWSVVINLVIITPLTLLLSTMFTYGGTKVVPNHWRNTGTGDNEPPSGRSRLLVGLQNLLFLAAVVSTAGSDMLGRLTTRYFVYFTDFAEQAGAITARWAHTVRRQIRTLWLAAWFTRDVVIRGRDPAAVLELMEVWEKHEAERHLAKADATATFTAARNELDSVSVQLAYLMILVMWVFTVWFQLTFATLIRNMLGDEAETEIILRWLLTLAADSLVITIVQAVLLHLAVQCFMVITRAGGPVFFDPNVRYWRDAVNGDSRRVEVGFGKRLSLWCHSGGHCFLESSVDSAAFAARRGGGW